jgi:hypothetical protein
MDPARRTAAGAPHETSIPTTICTRKNEALESSNNRLR